MKDREHTMDLCRLRCVLLLSIALPREGGGGGKADRRNVLCKRVASLDPFVSVCNARVVSHRERGMGDC